MRTVNIKNPDRSFSLNIPSVGEAFVDNSGGTPSYYIMTDQGAVALGQKDLVGLTNDGRTSPEAIARGQVLSKYLSDLGINPGETGNLKSYNIGDIKSAGLGVVKGTGDYNQIAPAIQQYKSGQLTGGDISKGFDLGYGQNVLPAGMTADQAIHTPQVKTDAYADYLKQSQQINQLASQSNDPNLKKNAQVLASLVGGNSYRYIAKDGTSKTITASSEQEAMSKATDRDPSSGFQFMGASSGEVSPDVLQQIQDTIDKINQTINKEGITDASGKVLLPPGVGLQGATNASNATNDVRQQLLNMGIDPKLVASIPDDQLSMVGIFTDYLKSQQALGNSTAQANLDTWQQALNAAKNDPDIQAKYGDALKMAGKSFDDAVSLFQTNLNITAQQQQQQFTDEQKAQAEAAASAGQVFSGFRQQAKEKLAQSQGGVIESTRAQLKKQISDLGTSFESQFGSSAVKPLSYSYLNPLTGQQESYGYTPVGGITGTNPLAQKADIFTKAQQTYDITKTP